MSYHNGSIWPHDNALIALGLGRYGFTHAVDYVFAGMLLAASYMEFYRLPELFCGFRRRRNRSHPLSGGVFAASLGRRRTVCNVAGIAWSGIRP